MDKRRSITSFDGRERVWFVYKSRRVLDTVSMERFITYAREDVQDDGYRITDDAPVVLWNQLETGELVRFGFTEEPGDYEGRPST